MKQPCVYILASREYGTLYIGVTSDLIARIYQHRTRATRGFTSRYGVYRLVRFELYATMPDAIAREKQLKRWHRQWKIILIESERWIWRRDWGCPRFRHAELVSASIVETAVPVEKWTLKQVQGDGIVHS